MKCYKTNCEAIPEWLIFVDENGQVSCNKHAEPIGSYVIRYSYVNEVHRLSNR